MTPEAKAKELIDKFSPLVTIWDCYNDIPANPDDILKDAKQCAIICIDEIISVVKEMEEMSTLVDDPHKVMIDNCESVKYEILKL